MTDVNKIAALNDAARREPFKATVLMTSGVRALPRETIVKLIDGVRNFDAFNIENDPNGEHDFGSIHLGNSITVCWKVDYYAKGSNHEYGSDDPSDENVTERVLTIMLSSEY